MPQREGCARGWSGGAHRRLVLHNFVPVPIQPRHDRVPLQRNNLVVRKRKEARERHGYLLPVPSGGHPSGLSMGGGRCETSRPARWRSWCTQNESFLQSAGLAHHSALPGELGGGARRGQASALQQLCCCRLLPVQRLRKWCLPQPPMKHLRAHQMWQQDLSNPSGADSGRSELRAV